MAALLSLVISYDEMGGSRVTDGMLATGKLDRRAGRPIEVEQGEWSVLTNPAPAIGGATVPAMLLSLL